MGCPADPALLVLLARRETVAPGPEPEESKVFVGNQGLATLTRCADSRAWAPHRQESAMMPCGVNTLPHAPLRRAHIFESLRSLRQSTAIPANCDCENNAADCCLHHQVVFKLRCWRTFSGSVDQIRRVFKNRVRYFVRVHTLQNSYGSYDCCFRRIALASSGSRARQALALDDDLLGGTLGVPGSYGSRAD